MSFIFFQKSLIILFMDDMDKTDTLFTRKAFDEVKATGLTVESKKRTVTDYFVTVCGERFAVDDLYETLTEVGSWSNICITNEKMVRVLKSIGVIESGGSRSLGGASTGANYEEFMAMVRELYRGRYND